MLLRMETTRTMAETIIERLLTVAGLRRDAQLATLLGVSPQAISQARKKDKVPESWLVRMAARYHVPVDWLLHGDGADDRVPHVAPSVRPAAPPREAYLRPPVVRPGHVLEEEPQPVEVTLVPLVSASLSAGGGSLDAGAEVLDHFAFSQGWLSGRGNPDQMVLMKVHGDSMEPAICHGDMVLIDQGKTRIYGHAMYAVGVNEEIYIKQVETLPGNRMLLRSQNERYEPIEVDLRGDMAESVRIIGKVIWWCREA